MADLPSIQMDLNERGFERDLKCTFLLDSKVVKLYDYHDVPYFLRGNPYVTSGYRAFLSFKMCIKRFVEGAVVFLPWVWLCFCYGLHWGYFWQHAYRDKSFMGGKQNIQKERLQINNMLITSLNPNYHSLRTPESFYFFD